MEEAKHHLDEWVAKQNEAWTQLQEAVTEKPRQSSIPFSECQKSFHVRREMLANLQHNKEQYAAWEANMAGDYLACHPPGSR